MKSKDVAFGVWCNMPILRNIKKTLSDVSRKWRASDSVFRLEPILGSDTACH